MSMLLTNQKYLGHMNTFLTEWVFEIQSELVNRETTLLAWIQIQLELDNRETTLLVGDAPLLWFHLSSRAPLCARTRVSSECARVY